MIVPLNLPKAKLKLSRKNEQLFVWCVSRKKTLLLTPEEWVRQHVIHYLVEHKNVPLGLIISEQGIQINELFRRCDVVVYGRDQQAKLVVECKATDVDLNQKVLHQIAHYNAKLQVDYLWITNGVKHVFYHINRTDKTLNVLDELPDFDTLSAKL